MISEKGMRFFNFIMQLSLAPFLTMASGLIAFECHLRDLTHEETMLLSGAANAAAFFFLPLLTSWSRISKWWRNRSTPKLD